MPTKKSYPDQARTLGSLLRSGYQKLSTRLYASLAEKGFPEIRPAHSAVFRHISPEGSRLTDLAEQAGMTKQSMAYLVGYLEETGFLKVTADAEDKRARRVCLTAKGRKLLGVLLSESAEIERQIAGRIGAKTMADLRRKLEILEEVAAQKPC